MISVPHALFGYVGLLVTVQPNETWKDITLGENGLVTSGIYYYTKGVARPKVKETGEQLEDRIPGWLNTEHPNSSAAGKGTLLLSFPVETQWMCISHEYNKSGLPNVKSINLLPHQSTPFQMGDNVFLVSGELTMNEKTFVGPTRIRIRTGDVIATAGDSPAYALLMLSKE